MAKMLAVKTSVLVLSSVLVADDVLRLVAMDATCHHDDDTHGAGGHAKHGFRDDVLSSILSPRILQAVAAAKALSKRMILYRMTAGHAVQEHVDDDYLEDGLFARYSFLVKLSSEYTGGETCFFEVGTPKLQVGDALIFPHQLKHWAEPVTTGEKCFLKGDLLC